MTTIEVPASVDVLISNTLALLLEPLGVDGTVGVSDLNELAGKTASIQASCLAFDNGLGDAIANVISLAASTALTQARVINIAAQYKPAAEAADAARLLEWLSYPELGRHLRSFEGVSESALQADHAEIAAAQRQLRLPLEMCRNANAKWPNGAHRTILDLGLDAAIRDLRDNGFLWIQTRSDGARDRVLKHMNSAAKRCSKGELAKKLELARDFSLASTTLDEKLHDSPRWWRWIVNRSTFQLQTTRIEALNWALMKRDADTISSDTMNLLTDGGWRRALHDCLREDPPAERPPVTATTLGSITCARLSAGLIVSGQPDSVALTAWKKWAHENTELLGRAAHVLDAADGHPAIAVQLDALGSSVQSVFGPPDTSRAKYRFIQAQVQEAVTTALSQRDQPAKPVEHTQLLGVTRTLGMLERALLQSVRATTPVQGILQVAIAGRTKSGKTTLRKALMRDGDRTGIGRGAQRTTRDVAKFVLDNVQ